MASSCRAARATSTIWWSVRRACSWSRRRPWPDASCASRTGPGDGPASVARLAGALLAEADEGPLPLVPAAQSAQALVELALMLPLVLGIVFGTIALSRLIQAQTAVVAVAHEAARAGSLGASPAEAVARMRQRVELVAP